MQISMQHPMISMTEVQPVLHQLFQRSGVTPVRLGTVHVPQVAIVPWHLYLAWWGALWRAKKCSLIEEMRSRTDAARMFTSYRRELEPLLMSEKQALRVVVVKARDREVGALLAWADWMRFAPVETPALPSDVTPADQRTHGIVLAHKHLSQFAAQFAEEEARGHREPITVTKQGEAVMVLVPWALYQQWQAPVEAGEVARPSLASDARPLSFADATLVEEVLTERKMALQSAFEPGKEWAVTTARTIIAHVEHVLDWLILFTRRDHLEDLIAYLEHQGWKREPHPNERLLKLTRPSTAGDPLVVFLPARLNWRDDGSPEYWDAEGLIRRVMRCQATLEQTTPYRILTRLRAFRQEEGSQRSSAHAPARQPSPLWPWSVGTAVQLSRDGWAMYDEAHEDGDRPLAEHAVFYILGIVSHFVDGPAYEDEASPHYHEPFGHPAFPGEAGVTFYTSLFTHDPRETGILMAHEIEVMVPLQPALESDAQIEAFLRQALGPGSAEVRHAYRQHRQSVPPRRALEAALHEGIASGGIPWRARSLLLPRQPYAPHFAEDARVEAENWIATFLFARFGLFHQREPAEAAAFLAKRIVETMQQRFGPASLDKPHRVTLQMLLTSLLMELDDQALEGYPSEEACNQAGREMLHLVISVLRPDLLQPVTSS